MFGTIAIAMAVGTLAGVTSYHVLDRDGHRQIAWARRRVATALQHADWAERTLASRTRELAESKARYNDLIAASAATRNLTGVS